MDGNWVSWRKGIQAGLSTTKMRQQGMLEKLAGRCPAVQELTGLCSESGRRQVSLSTELLLKKALSDLSMSNLKTEQELYLFLLEWDLQPYTERPNPEF